MSLTIGLAIFLLVDLLILLLFIFNYKKYQVPANGETPMVSILLAAKDEENNIGRCLDSLLKLSYSQDNLEILIGNDASSDHTLSTARSYEEKYVHIKVFDIKDNVGEQRGKANVLAQLAKQAKGECYLITDADMALPQNWVQYLLSSIKGETGMAIGVTQVEGDRLQDLDWLFALGMVKVVTDLRLPVTGMGNNMIISKEAYRSVGGYEGLPFSLTEDYELFKYVKKKGYQCAHVFQEEVLGKTYSIKGFFNLLNQRKRWMKGAIQLALPMLFLLSLQPGFYIGLIYLFFLTPKAALFLLAFKLTLRILLMTSIRKRLNIPFRFFSLVVYEFYVFLLAVVSVLYYLLPVRVVWKGRSY